MDLNTIFDDKVYSDSETSDILGLKVNTLAVWRSQNPGKLPFSKVGRKVTYLGATIKEFLRTSKVKINDVEDHKKECGRLRWKLRNLKYKYQEDVDALRARVRELERQLEAYGGE